MERLAKHKLKIFALILALITGYIAYDFLGPEKKAPAFGPIERPNLGESVGLGTKQIKVKLASKRKIPKTALVYKLMISQPSNEEIAKLASSFGFQSEPISEEPFHWKDNKRELIVSADLTDITFKDAGIGVADSNLDEKSLVATTKKFLSEKGLLDKSLVTDKRLKYLIANQTTTSYVKNFEQADFVKLSFDRKLGEWYVFGSSPTSSAATVLLNKAGQVRRLIYSRVDTGAGEPYPLRSVGEAADRLAAEGFLIEKDLGRTIESTFLSSKAFTKLTIEDVFLAYFGDDSGLFIQPIYIFRGRGAAGLYEDDVTIYVPAVEDKWLK